LFDAQPLAIDYPYHQSISPTPLFPGPRPGFFSNPNLGCSSFFSLSFECAPVCIPRPPPSPSVWPNPLSWLLFAGLEISARDVRVCLFFPLEGSCVARLLLRHFFALYFPCQSGAVVCFGPGVSRAPLQPRRSFPALSSPPPLCNYFSNSWLMQSLIFVLLCQSSPRATGWPPFFPLAVQLHLSLTFSPHIMVHNFPFSPSYGPHAIFFLFYPAQTFPPAVHQHIVWVASLMSAFAIPPSCLRLSRVLLFVHPDTPFLFRS